MSEQLYDLRRHAQRAMASADLIDRQLESPASARLIAAGRAFLAEVQALADEQRDHVVATSSPQAPVIAGGLPPAPASLLAVDDQVEYEVAPGFWRRGRVKCVYESMEEMTLWVEWAHGSDEVMASQCRRA